MVTDARAPIHIHSQYPMKTNNLALHMQYMYVCTDRIIGTIIMKIGTPFQYPTKTSDDVMTTPSTIQYMRAMMSSSPEDAERGVAGGLLVGLVHKDQLEA